MRFHQHTYTSFNNINEPDDDNLLSSFIIVDNVEKSPTNDTRSLSISICRHIFSFLSATQVIPLRLTCRAFDAAAQHRLLHIAADIVQSAASARTMFRPEVATVSAMVTVPIAAVSGTVAAASLLLYRLPWLVAPLALPFTVNRSSLSSSSASSSSASSSFTKLRSKAIDIAVGAVLIVSTPAWLPHLPAALLTSIGVSTTSVVACIIPAVVDNSDVFINILRKRRMLRRAEKLQAMIARLQEGKHVSNDDWEHYSECNEGDDGDSDDKEDNVNDDVGSDDYVNEDENSDNSYEKCEDEDSECRVSLCNVLLKENGIFQWTRCTPPGHADIVFTVHSHVMKISEPSSYDPIRARIYVIQTTLEFFSSHFNDTTNINPWAKTDSRTFTAHRKYSDFLQLYEQLCSDVPFFADLLPEFPSRSGIQGYIAPKRWSDDIIEHRRRYFNRFLREITRPRNDIMLDTSFNERSGRPPILEFLQIDMQWLWDHGVNVD